MDIVTSLRFFNKKLQNLTTLKPSVKSEIFDLATKSFKFTTQAIEEPDLRKLIELYSAEIFEVVSSNKEAPETCRNYIKFAIGQVVEKAKEK